MRITVANKTRHRPDGTPAVSITRPSPLANPFKRSKVTDREDALARYAAWLDAELRRPHSPAAREFTRLRAILAEHGALTLLGTSAPLPCHGDIIRQRLLAEARTRP
jgi:hypothetical protein